MKRITRSLLAGIVPTVVFLLVVSVSFSAFGETKRGKAKGARKARAASDRQGAFQTGLGMGVAVNPPVRFLINLNGEYFVTHNVSVGLGLDFHLADIPFTFDAIGFGRYNFDVARYPRLVPYVGAGIGGGAISDHGVMDIMLPDFGFKYEVIADRLFLGPDLSVHIVTDFSDTDWDFRILFLQAAYRF